MLIRFLFDCDDYAAGSTRDFDPGVADAYVNWRRAAEYVPPEPEPDQKAMAAPPRNKMMRPGDVRNKSLANAE